MSEEQPKPTSRVTPLVVVTTFVSLSEAVLGTAVTLTSGLVQGWLTAFVIAFPILIATVFFLIQWFKPHVWYPPTEFGEHTSVADYVEAMQRRSLGSGKLYDTISETVRSTIASDDAVRELTKALGGKSTKSEAVAEAMKSMASQAAERIREASFVSVDTRPILGEKGYHGSVACSTDTPFNELLDEIWWLLQPNVGAYTYGVSWVLVNGSTGEVFTKQGAELGKRSVIRDRRPLSEVGIRPGMRLEVVRYPGT